MRKYHVPFWRRGRSGNAPIDSNEYVESVEISLEIQEDKTDAIEDQVASLTEQLTELKQQVKQMYGDEDDWQRMSKTWRTYRTPSG